MCWKQLLAREEEIAVLTAERDHTRVSRGFSRVDLCPAGVTAGLHVAVFKLCLVFKSFFTSSH